MSHKINPIVVRTDNVAKELGHIAENNKVDIKTLDFKVLQTQTFTYLDGERDGGTGDNDDWKELNEDELSHFYDETVLLNPKFKVKQINEIEVFTRVENSTFDSIETSIGAKNNITQVYYIIKEGSKFTYFDGFRKEFIELINKKKMRANVLVGIFDDAMFDNLASLIANIRVSEELVLEKKEMILVCEGVLAQETIHDKMILHYESKKENTDEQDRVNYSKRGFLMSVTEGELLMEYIKPRQGEPGRNCRGEFLPPKEPIIANTPDFTIDKNIEKIETDDTIEYKAKCSGYIQLDGAAYSISTNAEVKEISFKTTGSIETELDADVSINVSESDVFKDAIGVGMDVEVNEINIDGNVGRKATVTAKKALVEGQVHQSSTITADELKINIHKGTARGKKIEITRLENGIVEGDEVSISQAVGGSIKARIININHLGSHVKMVASEKIVIEKTDGGENSFTIDPILNEEDRTNVSSSDQHLIEAKRGITSVQAEYDAVCETIADNEKTFAEVSKKLLHYKKNKVKMPASFVKKYQEFSKVMTHRDGLKKEIDERKERYKLLEKSHRAIQSDIFEARIICKDYWRGHNEVKFHLVDPDIDVMYFPKENSDASILGLFEVENDDDTNYFIKEITEEEATEEEESNFLS